jgi:hypothetical protein
MCARPTDTSANSGIMHDRASGSAPIIRICVRRCRHRHGLHDEQIGGS